MKDSRIKMRLYSEKEGEMKITEEIAGKLRKHGNKMILGIRGEDIKFDPKNIDVYKENKMNAVVDNTEILGNENNLYFECGGATTVARVSKYELCRVGDEVDFVFVPHRMHFFDVGTEEAIVLQKGAYMDKFRKVNTYIDENRIPREKLPVLHVTPPCG